MESEHDRLMKTHREELKEEAATLSSVPCPTCLAPVGKPCRPREGESWNYGGISSAPITDWHIERCEDARLARMLSQVLGPNI